MPRISMIVPVYNVVTYLSECVESIVKQSFQDYELILVDDGSTDGSGDLCDILAQKYGKIQVIHKENGGHMSARKAGLQNASGEYILYVDSDDYLEKNLLQNIEDIIKAYHPDIVAFGFHKVTETGEILSTHANKEEEGFYAGEKLGEIRKRLIYDKAEKELNTGSIANSLWSKIFRKNCIVTQLQAVSDEIRQGEDMAATMSALCTCDSLYVSRYAGYCYRQRTGSIVHSFDQEELANRELLISHLRENTQGIDGENIDLYAYFVIVQYIGKAANFAESYAQFRDVMKLPQNKAFIQIVEKIDSKYLALKEKSRFFCLKHELWIVFWVLKSLKQMVKREKSL